MCGCARNAGNLPDENILLLMTNGMEDTSIVEIYQKDIDNVEALTQGEIKIYQYEIDLNEDSQVDKIVCIQSSLHSGSHGDTVQILINENGEYREVLHDTYRLFMQDSSYKALGEIYILPSKQDGFKDIQVKTDEAKLILRYESGRYHIDQVE